MKVFVVIKDEGGPYELYPQIKRIYADEENANVYVEKNNMYNNYDIEEWEVK